MVGRLDRLTPAFSARERAILALRAWKEGVPEDPELRSKMPLEQGPEFARYIDLIRGTYDVVSLFVVILDQSLALLDARYGWLLSLQLWALSISDLADRNTRRRGKSARRAEKIAEAVGTRLREGIELRWRELLATEQVLEEVAAEFDGEDPARPQERRALAQGKETLNELHRQVQDYVGPFNLPGPDEDEVELLKEAIRRAGER